MPDPGSTSSSNDATDASTTAEDPTGATDTTGGLPPEGGAMPIWIAASNYAELQDELAGLGPFVVYAWASDPAFAGFDQQLALLQQIDAPDVTEIIMLCERSRTLSVSVGDVVMAS